MASYIILAIISFHFVSTYLRKNEVSDYNDILNTPIYHSVSLLAPAYNESATIIDNIRSLLSIHYPNFEVIIINDGSKDDTLARCIKEYDLVSVNHAVFEYVPSKPIRAIYKSKNKAFSHLTVVDKVNGGKSDALNAGINVSSKDYITCIDVDCILEQDAILKMMKPFIDQDEDVQVIATGGVVRIANSCKIEDGVITQVMAPENMVARFQALEYLRAFLLGRMAWSHIDGLMLISGALGVFNKKIAIEAGGYSHKTVGEDMELVVRMRRLMQDKNIKYTVAFIPDPLCWTEAPESWDVLIRQRNRWTRGTIETLLTHKKLFFNPFYGKIGLLSYPYWFFFEWLAPLLESFGILVAFIFALLGWVNWSFFFLMLLLVYSFTVTFSVLGLLIEEVTYHQYKREKDLFKLLLAGLIEPFIFHPTILYAAIMGNIDFITGNTKWGEMTRKGFGTTASAAAVSDNKAPQAVLVKPVEEAPKVKAEPEKKLSEKLIAFVRVRYAVFSTLLIVGLFALYAYTFTDFFTTGLIYGKEYSEPLKYKERSVLESKLEVTQEQIITPEKELLKQKENLNKLVEPVVQANYYCLVIQSFSNLEGAENFLKSNKKFNAEIVKNGAKFYVCVGNFKEKKQAEEFKFKNKDLPSSAWIWKNSN